MPCFHWGLPANHPISSFLKDLIHDSRVDRGFERPRSPGDLHLDLYSIPVHGIPMPGLALGKILI